MNCTPMSSRPLAESKSSQAFHSNHLTGARLTTGPRLARCHSLERLNTPSSFKLQRRGAKKCLLDILAKVPEASATHVSFVRQPSVESIVEAPEEDEEKPCTSQAPSPLIKRPSLTELVLLKKKLPDTLCSKKQPVKQLLRPGRPQRRRSAHMLRCASLPNLHRIAEDSDV